MKTEYWNKETLYKNIDKLRLDLGFSLEESDYPISSINLGKQHCNNLTIEEVPFPTPYICGILYKGNISTSIALNSNREKCMQNFDCMHELIHYFFHDISYCQLMCSEKTIKQDSYIEWQANEGAAQFLVPYQIFIPKYLELEDKYAKSNWDDLSIEELSKYFNVSYGVIKNRINNLETEILQYKRGRDIKALTLISKSKAISLGLDKFKVEQLYCKKCLNIIDDEYSYCPICGNDLTNNSIFKQKKRKGAGFMIYKNEIEVDEYGKIKICPRCHNEEILEGPYCKICGLELINRCSSYVENDWTSSLNGCNEVCDTNARYCHKCGCETTFYKNKLLCDYNDYIPSLNISHQELWASELNSLKEKGKIMLYTNLVNTELLKINKNTIGINYPKGLETLTKTILQKEENQNIVKQMINNIFNDKKSIKIYDRKQEVVFAAFDNLPF